MLVTEQKCMSCGVGTVQKIAVTGEVVFVFPCDCKHPFSDPEQVKIADTIWEANKAFHYNSAAMWKYLGDLNKALYHECSRKNCRWTDDEKNKVSLIENIFSSMEVSEVSHKIQRHPFAIFNIYMDLAYKAACTGDTSMYDRALKYLI